MCARLSRLLDSDCKSDTDQPNFGLKESSRDVRVRKRLKKFSRVKGQLKPTQPLPSFSSFLLKTLLDMKMEEKELEKEAEEEKIEEKKLKVEELKE